MNDFTEITDHVKEVTSDMVYWTNQCKKLSVKYVITVKHVLKVAPISVLAIRSDYKVVGELINDLKLSCKTEIKLPVPSELLPDVSKLILGVIYKDYNIINKDNYNLIAYVSIDDLITCSSDPDSFQQVLNFHKEITNV